MVMVAKSIESRYREVDAQLRATVVEYGQRIVADPELYFSPDPVQRELTWQIAALRSQFVDLKARYQSERGELAFLGCAAGEHKKCVVRTKTLVCACPCHGRTK